MRFRMDGEQFELSPDIVRDRLRGRAGRDIHQHWVEVDGVRWPVKQAFALVTGADASRFVSLTARRHFANLGFSVSDGNVPRSAPQSPRTSAAVAEPLELADSVSAQLDFTWMRAGDLSLDASGLPQFPPLPRVPGLYRFEFVGEFIEGTLLYIGESVDIARRASNYRNAKTDRSRERTSRRIHKELVAHLLAGGTITYFIATELTIEATGVATDLRLKSARRMAENAAVLLAQMSGTKVLNIDADISTSEEGHHG